MRFYVFRFLDHRGRVVSCHPIRLSIDAAAVRLGQRFLEATSRTIMLQIWNLARLVYTSNGYIRLEKAFEPARGTTEMHVRIH